MRKFPAVNAKHWLITYVCSPFILNWLVALFLLADFFTFCGLPMAGDEYEEEPI